MARKTKDLYNYLVRIAGTKVALEMFRRFQGEMVSVWYEKSDFCKVLKSLSNDDTLKEFTKEYHSEQLYIGKVDHLLLEIRNEEIIRKYDGTNIKDLVREYKLSEARLGQIVKNKKRNFKNMSK